MILVDTSVWVDHLRRTEPALAKLLDQAAVLGHPWVTGEIALGNLRRRDEVVGLLRSLPQAPLATAPELLSFIAREQLGGTGIGYVDTQLLAATRLHTNARLWTKDTRLVEAATRLAVGYGPG